MADSTSKPSQDDSLSSEEVREMRETLRDIFATNFPNPDHLGCPDKAKLKALAWRRKFPEAQEIVSHLGSCSPCYQEHGELVRQYNSRQRSYRLAAVALLIVGVALWVSWMLSKRGASVPEPPPIVKAPAPAPAPPSPNEGPSVQEPKPPEVQVVVLDLRKRGVPRGENTKASGDLNLPKGRLNLSIYLPFGSEEGDYEVRISSRQKRILTAKGRAIMQNRITVLTVELDTTAFEAGQYSLAIRQAGWGPYQYPIKVN